MTSSVHIISHSTRCSTHTTIPHIHHLVINPHLKFSTIHTKRILRTFSLQFWSIIRRRRSILLLLLVTTIKKKLRRFSIMYEVRKKKVNQLPREHFKKSTAHCFYISIYLYLALYTRVVNEKKRRNFFFGFSYIYATNFTAYIMNVHSIHTYKNNVYM